MKRKLVQKYAAKMNINIIIKNEVHPHNEHSSGSNFREVFEISRSRPSILYTLCSEYESSFESFSGEPMHFTSENCR